MSRPWLSVVGLGLDGLAGLGPGARAAVDAAEVLVGGERHLEMVPVDGRRRLTWAKPLDITLAQLMGLQGQPVVVLASGDPSWFGIARRLHARVERHEIEVFPHVSAFQLAAAAMRWSLEEVTTVSAHGRALQGIRRWLQDRRRLLVLTSDGDGPAAIARLLVDAGFGDSAMMILENLGGREQRSTAGTATELVDTRAAALNVVALQLRGDGLPLLPGLPDDAYRHDGQLTKAEIRAVTLAALAPMPGELLWDIGAGAGSVAIEWLRSDPSTKALAVEREAERADQIFVNAQRLGVPQLWPIIHASAPEALHGLPRPHAVFVGGGVADAGVLKACWEALPPGGRLVANAVTLSGEAALLAMHGSIGGRLLRLGLARAERIGAETVWRPAMPVTQLAARK